MPALPSTFIDALTALAASKKPRLLWISHAWGGGVEKHINDLFELVSQDSDVVLLRGSGQGGVGIEIKQANTVSRSVDVGGFDASSVMAWADALRALNFSRIHVHHIHGWPKAVLSLIEALNLPIDITLHDYFAVCPQYHMSKPDGRYCGEPDNNGCNACLKERPSAWGGDIVSWRSAGTDLLKRAARIIAPSEDMAARILRYVPGLSIQISPHPEVIKPWPAISKIALLGGLSPAKGLAIVLETAHAAKTIAPELYFRLIGHAAEPLPPDLSVTGSYEDKDLLLIIASERPDVLWLPTQVPESYGFTLSTALQSGIPIVASNIGAFSERTAILPHVQLLPHNATATEWIAAFRKAAPHAHSSAPNNPIPPERSKHYRLEYLTPIKPRNESIQTSPLVQLLTQAVPPAIGKDHPIIDIFRVGFYAGHTASVKEVERRLLLLPPGEFGVVGVTRYQALERDLHQTQEDADEEIRRQAAQHDEVVRVLTEEIRALAVELKNSERENNRHQDNLDLAAANISALQTQATAAREHITHLEAERTQLINSASWKITRPLRVVKRGLARILRITARAWRVGTQTPSLIPRALKLYQRGGVKALTARAKRELSPAVHVPESSALTLPPLSVQPERIDTLHLATSATPTISIVIPVYGQHKTTFACLKSIADHPPTLPFEVIIADDASPEPAEEALNSVTGVRFVRAATNGGFVLNSNQGAAAAKGEWLIQLNNDTVITHSAIDNLIAPLINDETVGLVGAKLLNADGSLQEAGGIIWQDGGGWNWGRGQRRDDPKFNFVREADYCSGAALAMRSKVFAEMGGFDTHYVPAYYEDTDLAFRMRARGLKVLYQPAAEIFHLEGVSNGRDETTGIKAYQVINSKKFFARWGGALKAHRPNAEAPELEAHRGTRGNILIIEACMITPDQDSGSVRMLNLLRILKRENYHVTFVANNLEYVKKYVSLLEQIGVEVLHGQWAGSVRKVLRERGLVLDAIMICRHYIASEYIDSMRRFAPKAKIIFDTVDLHFVREEREAELLDSQALRTGAMMTRAKELEIINQSDITVVVSSFEKDLLAGISPKACVEVISNIHTASSTLPSSAGRDLILFIGGFRHPPNIDAVTWYADEVLPHVRKLLPSVTTKIVGSNMTDAVRALTRPGLEIVGFVEDTAPLLAKARVSIAPLRYGAGVKGKVNEAMNCGIPVVATGCAVEGMHLTPGEEVMTAEDAEGFAMAIAKVFSDDALWSKLSAAGLKNVAEHFSLDAAAPSVRKVFAKPN